MDEVRASSDFKAIDCQEAQEILLSTSDVLAKRNALRDLSPSILYETCSLAGVDTASLALQRGSIYPTVDAMTTALVDHSGVSVNISSYKFLIL